MVRPEVSSKTVVTLSVDLHSLLVSSATINNNKNCDVERDMYPREVIDLM